MTQRDPKRESFAPEKKDSIIPAKDTGKDYPVDILREIYIKTDKTLEQLAKEYNLPMSLLSRYAKTGLKSWDTLKEEYASRRFEAFLKARDDALVETQSVVQRLETLHLMRLHLRMAEIEDHFKLYGDFFMRDSEGEIIRDGSGQGLEISIPSKHALDILKSIAEMREGNGRLLETSMENKGRKKKKGPQIDIDSYGLFGK